MYELTTDLASFSPPPVEHLLLFEALQGRPAEIDRFLGVLAGVIPIPDFFSPTNLQRLLGDTGGMTAPRPEGKMVV